MSSFYEASTSGMNWDRFATEMDNSLLNDSTTLKVKKAFWSAKQLIREKLGKREDEHVVAADAELDSNLQTFRQIRDSTQTLLNLMETQQRELNEMAQLELDIAELLTDAQRDEKAHLRKVLQVTGNAEANASKQRLILLDFVIRFGNVLYDFIERAVSDCEQTVEAAERARLDYRGSLLWLKKCSETLDPGDSSHMEDFRNVQNVVKCQKHRLDLLKEDMALKVDVLQKARNRILADNLEEYRTALLTFHSENTAEFCASSEQFDGLESYEIDVLKILNDPIGLAMEDQRKSNKINEMPKPSKSGTSRPSSARNRQHSGNDTNDLVELDEIELGVEACDPSMERVRELLRFEGGEEDDDDPIGMAQPQTDEVQLKCPAAATAGIGLNLLKHSSSSAADLFDDFQHEWAAIGCSTTAFNVLDKAEMGNNMSTGERQLNSVDHGSLTAENNVKSEKNGGALLEEIEDLLFESCPSSPKNDCQKNDQNNAMIVAIDGADKVPKLAPPPKDSATFGPKNN